MDPQREKRRQAFRVILVDSLMTLAAVSMVLVLVLVVSGYWINENFEVARSGMLQISSEPSGAAVSLDGENLMQRTNTSRVIPVGEHTVKLEKEGYDSWSKTIEIKEGLLYRLRYPRLFPLEREAEKTPMELGSTRVTISPKQDLALLTNNTNKWTVITLDNGQNGSKEIDLSKLFASGGEVLSVKWNKDQNRVLANIRFSEEKVNWYLIDLHDINRSVNLSNDFGVGFSKIDILNNSADELLALRNGNLQKINLGNKSISAILAEGVEKYYHYGNEIVFTAKDKEEKNYVGVLRLNKDEVTKLTDIDNIEADVFLSKFYDDEYLTIVDKNQISVFKRDNLNDAILVHELNFEPTNTQMGLMGGFVVMNNDTSMATLDMELEKVVEWSIESTAFGWLDESMIYVVADGSLIVYDFDGLNRRVITENVDGNFPATITNDKWLYYISENNLVRESL